MIESQLSLDRILRENFMCGIFMNWLTHAKPVPKGCHVVILIITSIIKSISQQHKPSLSSIEVPTIFSIYQYNLLWFFYNVGPCSNYLENITSLSTTNIELLNSYGIPCVYLSKGQMTNNHN